MGEPTIVVTNDDGIDSVGFRSLYEAMDDIGDVTAVAPVSDRSAVGRSIDSSAKLYEHELGYAIDGTPASCVIAALTALDFDPDLIVSGINKGANLGRPILARSGTVAAAIEAAYFGYPAIAVSLYIPFERVEGDFADYQPERRQFSSAAAAASHVATRSLRADVFERIDYININAPAAVDVEDISLRMTIPADGYHTIAERDGDNLSYRDRQFEMLFRGEVDTTDPTDRAAIADNAISISPLSIPNDEVSSRDLQSVGTVYADRLSMTETHN